MNTKVCKQLTLGRYFDAPNWAVKYSKGPDQVMVRYCQPISWAQHIYNEVELTKRLERGRKAFL